MQAPAAPCRKSDVARPASGAWQAPRIAGMTLACLLAAAASLGAAEAPRQPQAHAHNDYEHSRPLLDALDHGFRSVEADIHLVDGALLVAHDRPQVKADRTLEALYLAPLRQRVVLNRGSVHPGGGRFYLLIDFKSDGVATWTVLKPLLARYAELLTAFTPDRTTPNAVTIVISGNSPREVLAAEPLRYAAIDGRLPDLDREVSPHLVPWVSDNWPRIFQWRGLGTMPADERQKLEQFVARAHGQNRQVRFWGAPDLEAIWREQRAAGVDFINTDRLAELQRFLANATSAAAPNSSDPPAGSGTTR